MRAVESDREQRVSDFQNTEVVQQTLACRAPAPSRVFNNIARGFTMTELCASGTIYTFSCLRVYALQRQWKWAATVVLIFSLVTVVNCFVSMLDGSYVTD